jgi:hypothetical protein
MSKESVSKDQFERTNEWAHGPYVVRPAIDPEPDPVQKAGVGRAVVRRSKRRGLW